MPSLAELTDHEPQSALSEFNTSVGNRVDNILNKLTGANGQQRYQLWPEKVIRGGLTAAGDVLAGNVPQWAVDKDTGEVHTSPQMIEKAQEISALAGTGGLAGADATLGSTAFLRPALKYKDKIYKGKEGQQHQDVIPKELYPEFEQMAMNGEDISHYNFGFMNHKGQFLDREKALKYAIDEGLLGEHTANYGALTSTMELNSAKNFIPAVKDNSTGKVYSGDKNSNHPTLKYQDHKFLKDAIDGFADSSGNFLTRKEFDSKYGINESSKLTTQFLADSSKPGTAIEAMGKTVKPLTIRDAGAEIGHDSLSSLTKPDHYYRGMSEAEYAATIGAGKSIKSNESSSFKGEGTNFSHDARDAESYANFGRSDPRKTGLPNYLVEIKGSDGLKQAKDGYFKAAGEISPSRVTSIIKMESVDKSIMGTKIK